MGWLTDGGWVAAAGWPAERKHVGSDTWIITVSSCCAPQQQQQARLTSLSDAVCRPESACHSTNKHAPQPAQSLVSNENEGQSVLCHQSRRVTVSCYINTPHSSAHSCYVGLRAAKQYTMSSVAGIWTSPPPLARYQYHGRPQWENS